MPPFTSDLFTRLINHRVSDERARRVDFLTEWPGFLLANDAELLQVLGALVAP